MDVSNDTVVDATDTQSAGALPPPTEHITTTPPSVSAPPPPPSGPGAEEVDEEGDGGDSLSPLPMPFISNEEMIRQSEADASPEKSSGGFFGGIRQRRRSSIPVIATAQGAGATLEGKIHGTCLCRISMRSYIMKDWKPCLWVFENGKQLYVFRDADAYKMYHENPYLDDETKKFLLKGYFVLGVNHGCKPISHKEFKGETIHGFALEKITDFGSQNCAKFGHKEEEPMEALRAVLNEAINKAIAKRDEEEAESSSIKLEDVF